MIGHGDFFSNSLESCVNTIARKGYVISHTYCFRFLLVPNLVLSLPASLAPYILPGFLSHSLVPVPELERQSPASVLKRFAVPEDSHAMVAHWLPMTQEPRVPFTPA